MNQSIRLPNPADIIQCVQRKIEDILGAIHNDRNSKAAITLNPSPSTVDDIDKVSAFMTTTHSQQQQQQQFVTREELGQATWLLLHTLAAQYPDKPTRQQQKDVNNLFDILTRLYPCGHCATHFKQVIKHNPPRASNRKEFQHWVCSIHNVVNRRLGKQVFDCDVVAERWGGVECDGGDDGEQGCAMDWNNMSIKKNENKR